MKTSDVLYFLERFTVVASVLLSAYIIYTSVIRLMNAPPDSPMPE